jgi:hypothetical protein
MRYVIEWPTFHGIPGQIAVLGIAFQQPLVLQETSDSVSDGVRQLGQLSTRGCLHPAKPPARSIRAIDEDTIQKKQVEMAMTNEDSTEAQQQRHRTGAGQRAGKSRFHDQVRGNAAINDAEHLAHDRWTAGKQESQRVREAQHPLAHRLCRKDLMHQQRRTLGHAPGTATGTEAPPLAAKRQEVLGVTSIAPHA